MNECRGGVAVAVVDRKIFCSSSRSIECYDLSTDVWTKICEIDTILTQSIIKPLIISRVAPLKYFGPGYKKNPLKLRFAEDFSFNCL